MTDNRTINKNYPLPNPENIASQDVDRIAESITMIDADLNTCSESVSGVMSAVEALDAKSLRISADLVGTINTEIKNIGAKKYLVTNDDCSGFTMIDSGGSEGGISGEILMKKSDANFDTMWVNPKCISKKNFKQREIIDDFSIDSNVSILLKNECETDNSDDAPRVDLSPRCITGDVFVESQYSYLLQTEIEDVSFIDPDIASAINFGKVKIGDGVDVEDGVVSVPVIPIASKTDAGIVKIGDGIRINDGVISVEKIPKATHEIYGTVKPCATDFVFNDDGELSILGKRDMDGIIFQAANVCVVENNCITLKEDSSKYRLFVNEDVLITFDWSKIVQQKDLAFDVEIISDGKYVILFKGNIDWIMPCSGVLAGKTIVHFERKYGSDKIFGDLKKTENKVVINLTPDSSEDIQQDFICGHNGLYWNACECLRVKDYSNYNSFSNSIEGIWYIDFMRSTYVEYLEYVQGFDNWIAEYFYIEGSLDKKNWKRLLTRENVRPETYTLDTHGFFRYYRIRCRNTQIRYFRWFGYYVDDELYELKKVIPNMTANSLNGYAITSTGENEGQLYHLTQNLNSRWVNFYVRVNGEFWIKYELPKAEIIDLIDIGAPDELADRMPNWFKIEASNDDINWVLLLERSDISGWFNCETRQYYLQNTEAYKYYKFTPIEIKSSDFRIARFRLYRRIEGVANNSLVPPMNADVFNGFIASASSRYDSEHAAFYAFDGNVDTQWATLANAGENSWLQLKFPVATICTSFSITQRPNFTNQAPSSLTIQGSQDGVTFLDLKTVESIVYESGVKNIEFFNDVAFLYYRVVFHATLGGDSVGIAKAAYGTNTRDYKREINAYHRLIPVMNSDSQNGFIATASAIYVGNTTYSPFKAFSGSISDSSSWITKNQAGWIQIELPVADIANVLKVSGGFSSEEPESFFLLASNDGVEWVSLVESGPLQWNHLETKIWNFENETAYKFYKIDAVNTRSEYITISEIYLGQHVLTREY